MCINVCIRVYMYMCMHVYVRVCACVRMPCIGQLQITNKQPPTKLPVIYRPLNARPWGHGWVS